MDVTLCRCAWNIPGVEELPTHWHIFTNNLVGTGSYWQEGPFRGQEIMAMKMDEFVIHLVVNWKEVYRASVQTQQVQGGAQRHALQRSDQDAGPSLA